MQSWAFLAAGLQRRSRIFTYLLANGICFAVMILLFALFSVASSIPDGRILKKSFVILYFFELGKKEELGRKRIRKEVAS